MNNDIGGGDAVVVIFQQMSGGYGGHVPGSMDPSALACATAE